MFPVKKKVTSSKPCCSLGGADPVSKKFQPKKDSTASLVYSHNNSFVAICFLVIINFINIHYLLYQKYFCIVS